MLRPRSAFSLPSSLVGPALIAVAVFGFAGCPKNQHTAAAPSSAVEPKADPQAPIARMGGETITQAELDQKIKARLQKLEGEHAEQVFNLKSQALDEMIEQRLIDKKAKAEGLTPEKLIDREVTSKIPEPAAPEVQTVYDRAKASGRPMPPFDQVKGEIVKYLKDRSGGDLRKAYVDKLKAEAKVENLLPPLQLPKIEVAAEGFSKGANNAPVTIVEFSDFECPFCGRAEDSVKQVMTTYKDKVRLFYRDYPLPFHSHAQKASEAALCAGDQGHYWEMHEKLFANQKALDVPQLKQYAKDLSLDSGKFDRCVDSGEKAKVVEASRKAGDEAGVNGTPAFFINGRPLAGAQPFEKFKEVIDRELASGS